MAEAPTTAGTERMMHIGELAERVADMSLRTIRHYEETGLLKPSGRTAGGFRLYTERDLQRLLVIRRMKPLGYSLEEMGELLAIVDALAAVDAEGGAEARERGAALREQLAHFADSARERRAKLVRNLAWADEHITLLEEL